MTITLNGNFQTLLSHIESPALRAIAQFWHEARGNKQMPSWTDLPSSALSPYSKMLWGYQYDAKTGEFRGQLAGNKLRKWVDESFVGGRLQDVGSSTNYADAQRLMTGVVTTPLAARTSGRLFMVGDLAVTGERIGLPLATDGKTGDGILGASDYVAPALLGPVELIHENVEWFEIA